VSTSVRRTGRGKKQARAELLKAEDPRIATGNGISTSNRDLLRRLYASVLRFRMLGERTQYPVSGFGVAADHDLAIGDEAIIAGATLELEREDAMVSSSNVFATPIASWYSSPTAVHKNRNQYGIVTVGVDNMSSLHSFNLGTGFALAYRLGKTRNVVVAFSTQNTFSADRWHEAMKFAGAHKLPIVYVLRCKSVFQPGKSGSTPGLEEISFMARDCGFPGVIVDGSDAVAVWRVTQESIHRARTGAGPTLIDCETGFAKYHDPLSQMEHYMRKRGAWDDKWRRETRDGIEAEIKAASAGEQAASSSS
jgi:pyruvate dehydrogenase E1 component alpha subunit